MRLRALLAFAMACALVILTVTLGTASPGNEAAGDPPTATPSAKHCSDASRACMVLKVLAVSDQALDPPCSDVCSLDEGDEFTLGIIISRAPSESEGYILAQSTVDLGLDLAYKPAESAAAEIVWPDCPPAIALRGVDDPTANHGVKVSFSCLTGLSPPLPASEYVGNFAMLTATCSSVPSSTEVLHVQSGPGEPFGTLFTTADDPPETEEIVPDVEHITIVCGTPSGDTDTPTSTNAPTQTLTPSDTPTGTITPPTETPMSTPSPSATATATATAMSAATNTATPTMPPTATPTSIHTATPGPPTNTPTPPPTNTPQGLLGDVNCDHVVHPTDTLLMLQLQAALIGALPCPDVGDVDGDGETTLIDGALILQYSAGIISSLPP